MTGEQTSTPAQVLAVHGVTARYDELVVLRDINLSVRPGGRTALIGPNGAGKTTLLRLIAGEIRPDAGSVSLDGRDLSTMSAHLRARAGLCLIPDGRGVFPSLSVKDNLRLYGRPGDDVVSKALDIFPALANHVNRAAGALSGGQQKMVALARCWLASPRLVLLDEVSMGLAPKVVDDIFLALEKLAASGTAVLLVEQYVERALAMTDRAYLLSQGRIAYEGPAKDLDDAAVLREYLDV